MPLFTSSVVGQKNSDLLKRKRKEKRKKKKKEKSEKA
jgi:hypothetical protein